MTDGIRKSRSSIRPRRLSELWIAESPEYLRVLSDARLTLDQFHLNSVAGLVWQLCDGQRTVEEIARCVRSTCNDSAPDSSSIEADILRLVDSLREQALLAWSDEDEVDVLLVVPPAPSVYAKGAAKTPEYSSPPLGICYLAAILRENSFRVAITDLHQREKQPEDVVSVCRLTNPKVIGITACTPSYPNALRVSRFIKAWNADAVTVLGGPHAAGAAADCATESTWDYVCVGEGELPFLQLVCALLRGKDDPKKIPGFVHRTLDRIVHTEIPCRITDIDILPLPARDLLNLSSYHQKGAIVSSRGCPIGCTFCSCAAISGNTYRAHSIDRVMQEMQHLNDLYGVRFFDFHDDTFNLRPKRVFDFCRALQQQELNVEWGCFCRAAQMTPAMARAMAAAGCGVIQYGVEAGSDHALKRIHKQTLIRQVEDAVRWARQAGIAQIVCGFVIGHAHDTYSDARETIDFGLRLAELGATRLTLSLLTPYPGTDVYQRRHELGIELITDDWEQFTFSRVVVETSRLDRETLRRLYVTGLLQFLSATVR